MPELTPIQLGFLRQTNQRSVLYASFLRPRVLWTAVVNDGDILTGERTIEFAGGAGDHFDWTEPFQTVLVGSQPGWGNLGRARIRSITSPDGGVTGTVTVGANGIYWGDGAYLTFLHNYELWSIFPYIDEAEIFYKDRDIPYTDQNERISPIPIMGSHQARFALEGVDTDYIIQVHKSYSIDPTATISLHDVSIKPDTAGITISSYVPGEGITISIPDGDDYYGQYWVRYVVTDSNGNGETSFRSIFHHSRDWSSPFFPHTSFQDVTITGSWNEGGYSADVTVTNHASFSDIPDGTLVVLWTTDYFADNLVALSLFQDKQNIALAGYVVRDQFTRDDGEGGVATFTIATPDAIMKNRALFSISLEVSDDPDTWWKYQNGYLTAGHIVHHFYDEHSTLLQVCDVLGLDDDGDIQRKAVDLEKGNLYGMVDDLIRNRGIFAHLVCDKQGRVYMARDLIYRDEATRDAAPVVADIEDAFLLPPVVFVRASEPKTAFVFLSGVTYDGTDAEPIGSTAPYDWPSPFGGAMEDVERQMLVDQDDCNRLAGQIFAIKNNILPEIRIKFAGNFWGALDIALMEWWTLTVEPEDTVRELDAPEIRMICRSVTAVFDGEAGTQEVEAVFEPEVNGAPGFVYDWPPESPDPGGLQPPITTVTPGDGFGTCYVFAGNDNKLARTRDLSAASPVYSDITGSISGTHYDWILDPWNPYGRGWALTSDGVFRLTGLETESPTYEHVLTNTMVQTATGYGTSRFWYKIEASINLENYIVLLVGANQASGTYLRLYCAYSEDGGDTWNFGLVDSMTNPGSIMPRGGLALVPHTIGSDLRLYIGAYRGELFVGENYRVYRSNNRGASWSTIQTLNHDASPGGAYTAISPYNNNADGNVVWMAFDATTTPQIYKTTDGFSTFSTISLPSTSDANTDSFVKRLGIEVFAEDANQVAIWNSENRLFRSSDGTTFSEVTYSGYVPGTHGDVIAAGGFPYNGSQYYIVTKNRHVFVTIDGGSTWIDKTGNIQSIISANEVSDQGWQGTVVPLWLAE